MKRLILAGALLVSSSVMAKEVFFKFKVNSSGPKMYACNAGLGHLLVQGKICHRPGMYDEMVNYFKVGNTTGTPSWWCLPKCVPTITGTSTPVVASNQFITPGGATVSSNDCTSYPDQRTDSCVCTAYNDGNYLQDFMVAKFKGADTIKQSTKVISGNATELLAKLDNPKIVPWGLTGRPWFTNNSNFNTAVASPWGNYLQELTFNFGSEKYGAAYFVDICYQGSQIEYFENLQDSQNSLSFAASVTDLTNSTSTNKSYADLARPKVKVYLDCDLQGHGTLNHARDASGNYDTLPPLTATTTEEVNHVLQYPTTNLFTNGASFSVIHSSTATGSNWINQGSTWGANGQYSSLNNHAIGINPPRFCKLRYVFVESNFFAERKWQRHDAQFCTWTSIEETI
ncbi:MAG: hypothetical protein HQK51_06840 [Oligoflexia bacterium]|nr:hypothetical protein [Oligoflexia bacterium]